MRFELLYRMVNFCFTDNSEILLINYFKIPLISHSEDQRVTQLSDISDSQTVCILTQVLTGKFLFLIMYFGCTTNHRCIPFGCILCLLVQGCQGSGPSALFSGVFLAEVLGVGYIEGGSFLCDITHTLWHSTDHRLLP